MAGRETAEDRARRLIREEIAASQQRTDDEKNPGIQTLRRIINEVMDEREGRRKAPEKAPEEEKGGEDIWAALGIK